MRDTADELSYCLDFLSLASLTFTYFLLGYIEGDRCCRAAQTLLVNEERPASLAVLFKRASRGLVTLQAATNPLVFTPLEHQGTTLL